VDREVPGRLVVVEIPEYLGLPELREEEGMWVQPGVLAFLEIPDSLAREDLRGRQVDRDFRVPMVCRGPLEVPEFAEGREPPVSLVSLDDRE